MKLIVSANTAWNVANFRAGLVRALVADGHEVVVAAPPDGTVDRVRELGARFVPLHMDNAGTSPRRDAMLAWRFRRLLATERAAALLTFTVKPNVYGGIAARSLGIPVLPNVSGLGTAFIRGGWLARTVRALYRVALAGAPTAFFQNWDDRALFVDGGLVDPARTVVLPGSGVDLERFARAPMPEGAPGFLMVSRVLRDKGVLDYVEAARRVREARPDTRFELLGSLDALNRTAIPRSQVEAWVAEGAIEHHDQVADVRPHLAAAHCVVLPSYREGTPRTLLEAAATGRPLIATDVPGCREPIVEGVNGFLAQVRDPDDLARAMLALLDLSEDERATMGTESRRLAESRYGERIVFDAYREALDRM